MTDTTEGLRPLTANEARAVEMMEAGASIADVKAATGLTRAVIAAVVDHAAELARQAEAAVPAATSTPAPDAAESSAPEPRTVEPRPVPHPAQQGPPAAPRPVSVERRPAEAEEPDGWSIEQLLEWAQTSETARVKTLAARIRSDAADLRSHAGRSEAVRAAEADVATLTAQLAAAKEALRAARSGSTAKPAPEAVPIPLAEIRAWANAHGYACPMRGRIPVAVLDAYTSATAPGQG